MRKVSIILTIAMLASVSTGCLSSATRQHFHDKVDLVEAKTKQAVEENLDQVVLDILKKLDQRLQEKGIEIPEEMKEILVAEAQKLAREYALKGVGIGFDELHELIEKYLSNKKTE